jgi:hypothetical protein
VAARAARGGDASAEAVIPSAQWINRLRAATGGGKQLFMPLIEAVQCRPGLLWGEAQASALLGAGIPQRLRLGPGFRAA